MPQVFPVLKKGALRFLKNELMNYNHISIFQEYGQYSVKKSMRKTIPQKYSCTIEFD